MKKFNAFTLAEVLITLAIVGVVAALTMPSLIQHHKKVETSAKIKKFNNTINNWINLATVDYDNPEHWECSIERGNSMPHCIGKEKYINKYFKPYMNISKVIFDDFEIYYKDSCSKNEHENQGGVSLLAMTGKLRGLQQTKPDYCGDSIFRGNTKIILNDGTTFYMDLSSMAIPVLYDTNGDKKPNQAGKDRFLFIFSGNTLPELACGFHASKKRYFCADGNVNRSSTSTYGFPRDEALRYCGANGTLCSLVLEYDNWEFKDDYPIKL